jgi:hypothetical protein
VSGPGLDSVIVHIICDGGGMLERRIGIDRFWCDPCRTQNLGSIVRGVQGKSRTAEPPLRGRFFFEKSVLDMP